MIVSLNFFSKIDALELNENEIVFIWKWWQLKIYYINFFMGHRMWGGLKWNLLSSIILKVLEFASLHNFLNRENYRNVIQML